MKRVLIIIGAVLLVVLGLFMPRLLAAYQNQSISGDMRQMENAAVSLSLTQKLVALPELDLIQSLELFSSYVTIVELEEGRYTSSEEALQVARELLAESVGIYNPVSNLRLEKAVPFLLMDEDGHSGIFWRCVSGESTDEVVWIDDQHGKLMAFCLLPNISSLEEACTSISEHFYQPYADTEVLMIGAGKYCIRLTADGETFDLSVAYPLEWILTGDIPTEPVFNPSYKYLYFNIPFDAIMEADE